MPSASLIPHPARPANAISRVDVDLSIQADALRAVYRVYGNVAALIIPENTVATRADELWRTTCCELFLQIDARAYLEFNFSPSTQWAAYRFDDYRAGMSSFDMEPPRIAIGNGTDCLVLDSQLRLPGFDLTGARCGPTCVIAQRDGCVSYWAMAHESSAPDFHDTAVRQIVL